MTNYSHEDLVSYTVYETTHDGVLLTSQFLNRDDVNDYVDRFTSASSYVRVYRTSCCDVFYPLDSAVKALNPNAPTFTPSRNVTTSTSLDTNINALNSTEPTFEFNDYDILDTSRGNTPEPETVQTPINMTVPFMGMTIRKYGKSYIMCPPEGHPYWGSEYINENRGRWTKNGNGWFFRNNKTILRSFLDQGAIMEI
jgi:hypothetical protein